MCFAAGADWKDAASQRRGSIHGAGRPLAPVDHGILRRWFAFELACASLRRAVIYEVDVVCVCVQDDAVLENNMQMEVTGKLKTHFNTAPKHSNTAAGVSVIVVST